MVARLLRIGAIVAAVAVVAFAAFALWAWTGAKTSTVGELEFANPLAIPPLVDARGDGEGRLAFELELEAGEAELVAGEPTATWGANGPHLAPTIRASRGHLVAPTVTNRLRSETTTIHWHGMHLPAVADGGPHQTIAPGESWTPEWTVDQPAATLWYHPHPHRRTADHVYRGLYGMFIVDDPDAARLALPRDYGIDDIPVMIQDVRLSDAGALEESQSVISPAGRLGDEILVNGTLDPHLELTRERVRLRLLNASGARVYEIGFADGREFDLIATDGGLLAAPERVERVRLSPGERAEIVAAFEPGERAVLRSFEPDLGTNFFERRFAGGDDSFDLLELRAARRLEPSPEVPARLAALPPVGEAGAPVLSFRLSGQGSINGAGMDIDRIDEVVFAGSTEVWEIENASGTPHNFHPHGVSFRVLEYAGGPPPPALHGAKDTVYVPPNESVRLLVDFGADSDPAHPYMYHCHLLQHEDRGMMGQFTVVEER
ncbi:MAG TPA: multicopper oxidase domain-containing protein [Solirubrobacterales bacterium]|nr:multicopper oxidase domain-containing protein [Solirubrobacterales bacterium]